MKTIKIAGVPEHFNLPWHLCIENNEFKDVGIDLQWTDIPEGTGKMCQMLRDGETDVALILSEGIVKDIVAGNPCKIVQVYVKSPLMAYVNADNQGWDSEKLQFEIVNTIDGAVEALTNGTADYFMWEHFMTKPLVDSGVFRRVGDCPTPWPCFVIAVRDEVLNKHPNTIKQILEIINIKTKKFKEIEKIETTLATKYHQQIDDIQEWLRLTEWSQKPLSEKMLNKIQNQLFDLKIIDKIYNSAEILKTL